jgi:hypothetical protein
MTYEELTDQAFAFMKDNWDYDVKAAMDGIVATVRPHAAAPACSDYFGFLVCGVCLMVCVRALGGGGGRGAATLDAGLLLAFFYIAHARSCVGSVRCSTCLSFRALSGAGFCACR